MNSDHFPYVYENGHWIMAEDDEPSMLLTVLTALCGAIGMAAVIWLTTVILFLL